MKLSIVKLTMGKTKEEAKPIIIVGEVTPDYRILNTQEIPGLIMCKHPNTKLHKHHIGKLEVCKDCDLSRIILDDGAATEWVLTFDGE